MALGIAAPSMLILSIFIVTPLYFRGEATEEQTGIIITVQIKKTVTEIEKCRTTQIAQCSPKDVPNTPL
jgi:hypothetical protein